MHEHLTERNGQLIDQTADPKSIICNDPFLCVKNLAYIQSHFGFFIRFGDLFDLAYNGTVGNTHGSHGLGVQHILHHIGNLLHFLIVLVLAKLVDQDDAAFIHSGNKIFGAGGKQCFQKLSGIQIFLLFGLNHVNNPACFHLNVKLFRPVVNIHQKKIVQKQILNKVIFVKTFFVCNDQILNLTDCYFSDHIGIFAGTSCHKYVFHNLIIKNLEKMIALDHLAVCC